MAIVNVDLSEYDAIRKRNSELEEQVKELKKLNDSLKQGAKVILRKETVVVERTLRRRSFFEEMNNLPQENDGFDENRRTIKSSESYVNFEEVRLKVENAMQDEVKRSIHDRDCERRAYADLKNKLINKQIGIKADLQKEYEKKEKDLEAVYQDKERDLREKYARMTGNFEAERIRVRNKLPNIASMATDLRDELTKIRFFKPKLAIKLANDIIGYATKKD
jgi:hypothetical protein